MDPTILQLFSAEEILERLARKKLTGCFKVFTPLESANVFFKKGIVVAANKGEAEGEVALRQILTWKEALYVWQPDIDPPIPALKAVSIVVADFLGKGITSTKPVAGKAEESAQNGPSRDKQPGDPVKAATGAGSRTATKSITATAATRSINDEELLRKHRLVLVSATNATHRHRLNRVTSLIGRNPGCDIAIANPSISRQHCILQIMERGLHVKDLNTINGTKINGIVLKEGYINVGDKLTVGDIGFILEQAKD